MRVGSYDIHPGILVTIVGVLIALLVFGNLWLKNHRIKAGLQSMVLEQGWTWVGAAPQELKELLSKLYVRRPWHASLVAVAQGSTDAVYLFRYERKVSTMKSASSTYGFVALLPGKVAADAPLYVVRLKPSGGLGLLSALKADLLSDVGSEAFREHFVVQAPRPDEYLEEAPDALRPVEIAPALEEALLRLRPAMRAQQDWIQVVIRDELVAVALSDGENAAPADFPTLLEMGESISQALR